MTHKKVWIEGMSCQHCVKRVENALKELEGVKTVKVDLKKKTADMELLAELSFEKIKTAIEDVGYEVTDIR